jgi:DNA-binding beta-propeller fold protein YncE
MVALSLAGLVLLLATAVALAATGDLTQPAGTTGCVSETGSGPCANGHALDFPQSVAVAPGGKSVYVVSLLSDAVVRFNRNTTNGFISQPPAAAGCVSETGAGPCADGHALRYPKSVAVSADGKSVYVASSGSNAVARLVRNTTTGAITQPAGAAGCISETGAGPCADGHGLYGDEPLDVAVAPDGRSVYAVSSLRGTVVRFNRNTTTGAITQPAGAAGCVSETGVGPCANGHGIDGANSVAVAPGGKSVYVTAGWPGHAVARFNRNTTTGAITQPAGAAGCVSETGAGPCANGRALDGANDVAVSADGRSVYVASYGSEAVARFNRNTITGVIGQPAGAAGCVSDTGAGPCADGHALGGAASVAVSSDGKSVYVASGFAGDFLSGDAVVRFNRSTTSGAIAQPAGPAGCVSDTGSNAPGPCADGHALFDPRSVAVSLNGKSVYVVSHDAVTRFKRAP